MPIRASVLVGLCIVAGCAPIHTCETVSPPVDAVLAIDAPGEFAAQTDGQPGWVGQWTSADGTVLAEGLVGADGAVNATPSGLMPGEQSLRFTLLDKEVERCSVDTRVIVAVPPELTLLSPSPDSVFPEGEQIILRVAVADAMTVRWRSDVELGEVDVVDGVAEFAIVLPPGVHDLTATATSEHLEQALSVQLRVDGRPSAPGLVFAEEFPTVVAPLRAVLAPPATDPEDGELTYSWRWTRDGDPQPDLVDAIVPEDRLRRGEVWAVTVAADDGLQSGPEATLSTSIFNTLPAVARVEIDGRPTRAAGASCSADAEDLDGDPVDIAYRWESDGVEIGTGAFLAGDVLSRGDDLRCLATPSDDEGEGEVVASVVVTVGNTPPAATGVEITPSVPEPGQPVSCELLGGTDADGDTVTANVDWEFNGVFAGTGAVIPTPYEPLATVRCIATPYDGVESGVAHSATVTLGDGAGPANVLLIVADDLGVEKLDSYGLQQSPPPTPNIDRLAAEGLSFTRAYSNPTCTPTRVAMLTGRHSSQFGVGRAITPIGGVFPIDPAEILLPEALLQTAPAVSSAAVGKWHLAVYAEGAGPDHPRASGFLHYDGVFGNLRSAEATDGGTMNYDSYEAVSDGVFERRTGYLTTNEADEAIALMEQLPEPWFILLALHTPHLPFHVPPPELTPQWGPSGTSVGKYNLMIQSMDTEIGRVLETVPFSTTVVFMGDNGTPSNAVAPPLTAGRSKGTAYEGGIRVPLIVRGPDVAEPGTTCDALVHALDVYPTVLDVLGGDVPVGLDIDGRSFYPYLFDAQQDSIRTHVYSEYYTPNGYGPYTERWQTVRDDRFKLLRQQGLPDELYDLGLDWREGVDLLPGPLSPEAQDAYDALSALLETDDPDGP